MARVNRRHSAKTIAGQQRQDQAAALRAEGHTYEEIAEILGYANRGGAAEAVRLSLARYPSEKAAEVREIENMRLEQMWKIAWEIAQTPVWVVQWGKITDERDYTPNLRALAELRQISERRSKLYGADAPTRKQITVLTEDMMTAEIKRMEAELKAAGVQIPDDLRSLNEDGAEVAD
jgi:hypothetical protein